MEKQLTVWCGLFTGKSCISTTFNALWSLYYASELTRLKKNGHRDCQQHILICQIDNTAELAGICYPTLKQSDDQFRQHRFKDDGSGNASKWYNYANTSCQAVVTGVIPGRAVAFVWTFDEVLRAVPPVFSRTMQAGISTRLNFDKFCSRVKVELANGATTEWDEYIAARERRPTSTAGLDSFVQQV